MQELKVVKALTFESHGYKATCTVQVGEVKADIVFSYSETSADKPHTLIRPDELLMLEKAGLQLNYEPLLDNYKAALGDLDNFRKKQKIKQYRLDYEQSVVAGIGFSTDLVNRCSPVKETLEEYIADRTDSWNSNRSREPYIYVTVGGLVTEIQYRNTSTRSTWHRTSSNERMRFCINSPITDKKDRQYTTLEKCIAKIEELVPNYLEEKKAKEDAVKEKVAAEKARKAWITSNFPEAEKEKYGSKYLLPIGSNKYVKLNAYRAMGSEANTGFMLGDIPRHLTKQQVLDIIKIINTADAI